jgi:signal transduction histidine kinase
MVYGDMSDAPTIAGLEGALDFRSIDAAAVAQYSDVSSILEVCARTTGMGYCVVAHVTEDRWLACAVLDQIDFNLPAGGELPIKTTLCNEVRECRRTIAFDHASQDAAWRDHQTPKAYGLESYIAAPIILEDGEFFGTLCAIDPRPAPASRSDIVRMFELFAKLISNHLDAQRRVALSEAALSAAQVTSDLREQFIAVLGHDLRNPLAALDGGVRLLRRRTKPDPGTTHILDEMDRSNGRMVRLISDVLDFARGRLGGGLAIANRQSAELTSLTQQVVSEIKVANPDRIIRVEITPGLKIEGDPDRIAQLMSNLLANAVAHGDPQTPIEVIVGDIGGMLEMAVVNGGAAIPEDVRPGLFQPFHRGRRPGGRDGLGLGLYIASEIAKAHGGALTVTSDARETRFVFRMPSGSPST